MKRSRHWTRAIEHLGREVQIIALQTRDIALLCVGAIGMAVLQLLRGKLRLRETRDAFYVVGAQSLPIIAFALTFLSLVMIAEFSFHMKLVLRQDSLVPSFSTVLMLRELGPVVTSLLITSRAGASIAAEIGTMKLTDQLDALETLGVDLLDFILVPRWYACVAATVLLSIVAVGVSSLGGAAMTSMKLGYTVEQYRSTMFLFVRPWDFVTCGIKAAIFGAIIPVIASYHGFHCARGSHGVGTAATKAVVQSSILIILADFLVTFVLTR